MHWAWGAAALLGALAGCASPPAVAPPVPPALPPPAPAAPAAPPPAQTDWRDVPLTPGDWSYSAEPQGSRAAFGGSEILFLVRCDAAHRQVLLSRPGSASPLAVRTSYGERSLPAAPGEAAGAALSAADPVLDEIAFSRGRFTVEAQGLPTLVVPAWAEPARVIEDCRG